MGHDLSRRPPQPDTLASLPEVLREWLEETRNDADLFPLAKVAHRRDAIRALARERDDADAAYRQELMLRESMERNLQRAREELALLRKHIRSSHAEVACSQIGRHADDGDDPVPMLTCLTDIAHENSQLRAKLSQAPSVTAPTLSPSYNELRIQLSQAREELAHTDALAARATMRAGALHVQLAQAQAEILEDRAVCLCGCPPEQHELVGGDDGEQCEHEDHQCLRAAAGIVSMFADLRAQLATAQQRIADLESHIEDDE